MNIIAPKKLDYALDFIIKRVEEGNVKSIFSHCLMLCREWIYPFRLITYQLNDGALDLASNLSFPDGELKSKYSSASFVVPKSLFDPVSLTLLNASLKRAL